MKYVAKALTDKTADLSRGRFDGKNALKGLFSAVLTIAVLYFIVAASADYLADNISDTVETKWLAKPYAKIFDDEPPEIPRATATFNKLLISAPPALRALNYELVFIDDTMPNAFAFPGGGIGVTSGLLKTVKSEEGLAFVLAHELAHHDKRHVLKRFWRTILWATLLELGGLSDAGRLLSFSETRYSRETEKEADLYALQLVYPLYGDNAAAYVELFNHFDETKNIGHWGDWLKTHPDTQKRIRYIQAELDKIKSDSAKSTD